MSTTTNGSRFDAAVILVITLATVAVGLWVAETYVGFHAPVDHCPDSEFSCPSAFNPRNIDAYAIGIGTTFTLFLPVVYLYRSLRWE